MGDYYDYGFDLPDVRHTFLTTTGRVEIVINRHWYQDDEQDDPRFKVSWTIRYADFEGGNHCRLDLPVGITEDKALRVAHELYEEDEEATQEWNDIEAEYAAERRMGA